MDIAALVKLAVTKPELLQVLGNIPQIMAQFEPPKDGHKTTEFWMTAAINVFILLSPAVPAETGLIAASVLTGVYTLARAIIKGLHAYGKASSEPDLPDLATLPDATKKSLGV